MNATLSRSVDARRAEPGDEVTATLAQDVQANGAVVLRRGTTLIGRVTEAQPRVRGSGSAEGRSDSRLGIVFERAILDDGREVPFHAMIQAVAAADAVASSRTGAFESDAATASSGAAGGGLLGGVNGVAGGAIGTAGSVGGSVAGSANSAAHGTMSTSAGAVGGLSAAGRFVSGSRGVFGMSGVEMIAATGVNAQGEGSVLTSSTGNVALERGTQMLLVGQAAGSAQGSANVGSAAGRTTGSVAATGSASGSAGVSRNPPQPQ